MEKTGRITAIHCGAMIALVDGNEENCRLAGKFFRSGDAGPPAVGDWVRLDLSGTVTEILPRKNVMTRKAAGRVVSQSQVIAANIDRVFIVSSLNQEFNLRRIERYLSFLDLHEIECTLVLTKSDICSDIDSYMHLVRELNLSEPPIYSSVVDGRGLDEIEALLTPGTTAAFIGSSGVGKSSIINYLLNKEAMNVAEIRGTDGKGRHTTTHRQLFLTPNGAAIIDSPGMRELQFYSGGEPATFEDIEALAAQCKFRDCRHKSEPDCAVKAAIKHGLLTPDRLKSYEKIRREMTRRALVK